MKLSSVSSKSSSSTTVGSEFAHALLDREIRDWRKDYRDIFRELTVRELQTGGIELMQRGLSLLAESVVDASGLSSTQAVAAGWDTPTEEIVTVMWRGAGAPVPLRDLTVDATHWVNNRWAEPAVTSAVSSTPSLLQDQRLLIALAAGAECAPTKHWLAAGGSVVAVMRPNPERWKSLMSAVADGATLVIPIKRSALTSDRLPTSLEDIAAVAGVDMVNEAQSISGWLRTVVGEHSSEHGLLIAGFGYSPGASHVTLQVIQDALMMQLARSEKNVALTWLGTPTDSLLTPLAQFEERVAMHRERGVVTKSRDALLSGLRLGRLSSAPESEIHSIDGREYAMVDCSADMQGPNYLMAKRSQRWRAMVAAAAGIPVAYCVTPAARTHSVLDHRILQATYRGAPRFGVRPFEVEETQQLTARLIVSHLSAPVSLSEPSAIYLERAVHGGLWRCTYNPQEIWKAATVLGWPALLSNSFR